jgi:hypothetical protein
VGLSRESRNMEHVYIIQVDRCYLPGKVRMADNIGMQASSQALPGAFFGQGQLQVSRDHNCSNLQTVTEGYASKHYKHHGRTAQAHFSQAHRTTGSNTTPVQNGPHSTRL